MELCTTTGTNSTVGGTQTNMQRFFFMLRLYMVGILCALTTLGLKAQSVDEIKANEAVYLWGEGTGDSQREAKENALHDQIGRAHV